MKFLSRFLVLVTGLLVFTAIVRCGRDSHIKVTEEKVPNPAGHPIQPRAAGQGDGFGPTTPDPEQVRGTRPEMPAIQTPPPADPTVFVPPVMVPPIPPVVPIVPPKNN